MSNDSILDDLNEAQRQAVTHGGGPMLVIAGAGSGKTRVITRRIAWLVREGVPDHGVLAITFTNKAAAEMRERVDHMLGRSRAWISTFHAFGARILRLEAQAAGLEPGFTILDESDRLAVIKEVLKELGYTSKEHRPGDFAQSVSKAKNRGELATAEDAESDDEYRRVYAAYESALRLSQCLDFDDLLLRTLTLFQTDEIVRRRVADRFRTVLIDEYQDTNVLQFKMAQLLVRDHQNVCATGDPDQSIYSWRGAEIRNILDFHLDFPGAVVVKLEENYRSTNTILRGASAVIRHNTQRIERELWSTLGDGEPLRLIEADTESFEAERVVDAIKDTLLEGTPASDIAVFYRTNACSRPLEGALRRANLPYVIVGAVEFYERREVKDLLAYLRLIANPADTVDLARIINVPARGIGAKTLSVMREHARRTGRPLLDVVRDPSCWVELRGAARRALEEFSQLMRSLLEAPRSPVLPLLDRVLEATHYRDYLAEMADPLVDERLENVDELRAALAEYDHNTPDGSLEDFIAQTALLRARADGGDQVPMITLMTLHSAKGLEFPVVYLTALEEGILPHARSASDERALEEERRLMYVGMTRAQRRLTLSFSRSRAVGGTGGFGRSLPSRFLSEIPDELFEGGRRGAPQQIAEDFASYEPDFDSSEPPFQTGDFVAHAQFGPGQVVSLSGFGASAKVTVEFVRHGTKKLLLEYAKLRKVRDPFGADG